MGAGDDLCPAARPFEDRAPKGSRGSSSSSSSSSNHHFNSSISSSCSSSSSDTSDIGQAWVRVVLIRALRLEERDLPGFTQVWGDTEATTACAGWLQV